MTTWEDVFEGYIGLAWHFVCTSCLNPIFRGSTGHWGHKIILNKVAPDGGIKDEQGHQIVFQCADCVGREPVVAPVVDRNGKTVSHVQITTLADAQDKAEITRIEGDYNARKEIKAIQEGNLPKERIIPNDDGVDEMSFRIADRIGWNMLVKYQDHLASCKTCREHYGYAKS